KFCLCYNNLMVDTTGIVKMCSCCREKPSVQRKGGYCSQCRYEYDIWRLYRLSRDDYRSMLAAQMYCCAICTEPFGERRPHIDHDHACEHPDKGRSYATVKACCRECVRGLLCGE